MPSHLASKAGFSLVEIMLTLGLSIGVLALIKEPLMDTLKLQTTLQDRNVWQNLEDNLKRSVLVSSMFDLALDANPDLGDCMRLDSKLCKAGSLPLKLFLARNRPTTGGFKGLGESCEGEDCPVSIEARFRGLCRKASPCDVVGTFEIEYRILVKGNLFKKGLVHLTNSRVEFADSNIACGVDNLGRSEFAHRISTSSIACLPPPRLERKISGIQLGDCADVNEVLVGFETSGARICAPILRKKR